MNNTRINTHQNKKGFTIVELMIATVVFTLVLLMASAAIIEVGKKYYKGITYARTQEVARSVVEEISQSLQFTSQGVKVPNYPDNDGVPGPDTKYNIYSIIFASQIGGGSDVSLSDSGATAADTFYFCVGPKRYSFALNKTVLASGSHVFWVDEPLAGCANAVSMGPAALTQSDPSDTTVYRGTNGRELLDRNMRITNLSIAQKNNGLWIVSLSIANGDADLLLYTHHVDDSGIPTGDGRVSCKGSMISSEFCATSEISSNVSKRIQ